MASTAGSIIPTERIQQCIYRLRRQKVMLDSDLAKLYGVQTKVLVRAVKRNIERFPGDFMFQLTREEYDGLLRCQIGTSKTGSGGRRYLPYAFTEQGIAMRMRNPRNRSAFGERRRTDPPQDRMEQ